jgi:hypothetical protein
MKTALFRLTIALLTLVPFGATAQVNAGDDAVLECDTDGGTKNGTEYTLNGMAPPGEGIVNEWTTDPEVDLENADTLTPTGEFPLGDTTVTLTSTPDGGEPESDSAIVTVEDTQPPVVRPKADPFYLWPPNHEMIPVAVRLRIRDACSGRGDFDVKLTGARSSEPDNGTGDGNTTDDIQGTDFGSDDRNVLLRAERKGNGNGRVYTLTYHVKEGDGDDSNETDGDAIVRVPHDASDLKDLIGDRDEMDRICPRPADAVDQLADLFPGFGSVRNAKACNKVCKAWAKSCKLIGVGSAKCVQGETRALALVAVAECKDSDDRGEIKECRAEVKAEFAKQKAELKVEVGEAKTACKNHGERCINRCDDLFGELPEPIVD